jgi:hypothetical protein
MGLAAEIAFAASRESPQPCGSEPSGAEMRSNLQMDQKAAGLDTGKEADDLAS